MENVTNDIDSKNNISNPEQVIWPTKKTGIKKKYLAAAVFAATLVLVVAAGSFYFVRNLNQASTLNAPASQPQAAAGKNQVTRNTQEEGCGQGCGSNEYCDAGRCRAIGGKADGRSDAEKAHDSVVIATPTPKSEATTSKVYETIPGYRCTEANCNSGFRCINDNTCVNIANPNLSVANDPDNCNGTGNRCSVGQTCIMGKCETLSKYKCVAGDNCKSPFVCKSDGTYDHCVYQDIAQSKITPYKVITPPPVSMSDSPYDSDEKNCGARGVKCATGVQICIEGTCISTVKGAEICNGITPDQTIENGVNTGFSKTCCVPAGIGVNPNPDANGYLDIDKRVHWTNCASGTTCRQGVGCIGTPIRTTELTSTEITTTITTTVTIPPTTTVTIPPTTTVTIPPTITETPTGTVTPTIAVCNETCEIDSDCSDGLYCDTETNKCRKEECSSETSCVCPTETPEPTIVDCNKRCNSDDNCSTGLKCDSDSGRCRKPACSDEKDCSCPKPRKTDSPTREITRTTTRTAAQPTVLKEAGILDFPGAAVFGSGLLLTVIGILLAL